MNFEVPQTAKLAAPVAILDLSGVSVSFGRKAVLNDVNFTLAEGEIVTIIGPNGAGKSTLVKAVMGLVPLSGGQIKWYRDVRLGYVPQKMHIDPVLPLKVRRLMTLTGRASRADVQQALDETGAGHLMDTYASDLSGGEFQRVMIARALLRNPDLLVLDEPVQGVDFAGEAALYDLIGRLSRERGFSVLMVSHDLHLVMAATDRVICLNGHVCCAGSPSAVTRDPAFLQMFGKQASSAYAVYAHHHDHDHDMSGEVVGEGCDHPHHQHIHHHHPHDDLTDKGQRHAG